MNKFILVFSSMLVTAFHSLAQDLSSNANLAKKYCWQNYDWKADKVMGASVNKTYTELISNRKAKKNIVVSIITVGVDIKHPELTGKIWVNKNEIPGNNIDDDNNGYVDDINGWNFLGNAKGENIEYENYEFTRICKLGESDPNYSTAQKLYDKELEKRRKERDFLKEVAVKFLNSLDVVKEKTGKDIKKLEDLTGISTEDNALLGAIYYLRKMYLRGFSESELLRLTENNEISFEKYLNKDFNPRVIIGDNVNDINDSHYGNPDVIGPNYVSGTSAAVIIAGIRDNELGIDGIATDVRIMPIRAVPKGDERDKDIALAIRYAVNNGADVICMSFRKKISPQKKFIDDALKYAEQKNVLIVRSAGDEAENLDHQVYYPNGIYSDMSKATNFICVGASRKNKDDTLVYIYSNYGRNNVDIFAPGSAIYSADLNNEYRSHSGSGPAAHVVTGIAALLLSYHPELKPSELIEILLASSTDCKRRLVLKPSQNRLESEMVKFESLCKSGGIINAYEALKMADARPIKN